MKACVVRLLIGITALTAAIACAECAQAGKLRQALVALDVAEDLNLAEYDLALAEQNAERAALSVNRGQVVSWTSRNVVWLATASGYWQEQSAQVCRAIEIKVRIRSQEGINGRELASLVCVAIGDRRGSALASNQVRTDRNGEPSAGAAVHR